MPQDASLTRAAENIIGRSFGLRADQNLLIFADPGSLDVATLVAATAGKVDVHGAIFLVPYEFQAQFGPNESLPLTMEAAIRETDAVLNCLSARVEYLAFRRRVLRTSWSRRVKLAHAPGLTLNMLAALDTDYELIRRHCNLLATALVLGRQAEVITHEGAGREHRLLVDIAGWDFTPGISDGIIHDGAWSNLPPGETFIVPLSANGSIVINGSLPGRVLEPGEELVLTFQRGRLSQIHPEDGPAARHLDRTQIAHARRLEDSNWTNLAELGFGVNPAVEALTGIELADEKKAGTVHIALGDSHSLGGNVESAIHCDLVVEPSTVLIDGRPVLAKGELRAELEDWLPDYRTATLPADWWHRLREIRRSGVRAERSGDQLVRQWNSGPGRWDSTPVGSEETARLAARLYNMLPAGGEKMTKAALLVEARRFGLDEPTVAALVWVMRQYDLVRFLERSPEAYAGWPGG